MDQAIEDNLPPEPGLKQKAESWWEKVKDFYRQDKFTAILVTILVLVVVGGLVSFLIARHRRANSLDQASPSPSDQIPSPSDNLPAATPNIFFATNSPMPSSSPSPSPSPSPSSAPNTLPDAGHSSFNANPSSVPADGSTQSSLTITLHDSNNNPLSGLAVSLATSDSRATFNPLSTGSNVTDLSGKATFSVTSTNAGTDSINVTATTSSGVSATLNNLGSVTFTSTSTPSPTP